MSEFTIWVVSWGVGTFALSWLLFWVQLDRFSTVFGLLSLVAATALVIMGMNEIIQLFAIAMGF